MKTKIVATFWLFLIFYSHSIKAQLFTFNDQGIDRTYILHLPSNYNPSNSYALVINLHGVNSNAQQQQNYSQFDAVADSQNFIVVYPNAINESWTINGSSDVTFISNLIDYIRENYSCNSCLFIAGMSQGGFLTYKLACDLTQSLTAIAVVSGNMSQFLQNNCAITNGLPIFHFHGTEDEYVNYNGVAGIPSVETTISWLVNQNNCTTAPIVTSLPNTNLIDNCTVEKYYYGNGTNGSELSFYKILNGGHTWPGASPIPLFGNTNQDINASNLIGNFFNQFCTTLQLDEIKDTFKLSIYPNPSQNYFTVALNNETFNLMVYDLYGRVILNKNQVNSSIQIDCSNFSEGVYFIQVNNEKMSRRHKVIIK